MKQSHWQVVSQNGNVHFCSLTKKAAERFLRSFGPHTSLTLEPARPGFCPVHRIEHRAKVSA